MTFPSDMAQKENDHLKHLTQRFYLRCSAQSMSRLFTITQYISAVVKNDMKCSTKIKLALLTTLHVNFYTIISSEIVSCIYVLHIRIIYVYIRLVHESISVAVKLLTFQEAILCTESRKPICNEIRLKRRNDNKRKSAHKIGNILS